MRLLGTPVRVQTNFSTTWPIFYKTRYHWWPPKLLTTTSDHLNSSLLSVKKNTEGMQPCEVGSKSNAWNIPWKNTQFLLRSYFRSAHANILFQYDTWYFRLISDKLRWSKKKILLTVKIRGNSYGFDGWCLPYKAPAVVSQHVWTPSSTVQVVDLGNIPMEPIAKFIGHGHRVFRERNLNGGAEN
jgi:hypothetical protein